MTLDRGYPRSSVMSAPSVCRLNPDLNKWCIETRKGVARLVPGLHEVFLGGRQSSSVRLMATDYSIADQLWIITSSAIKCGGPRTGAIELPQL